MVASEILVREERNDMNEKFWEEENAMHDDKAESTVYRELRLYQFDYMVTSDQSILYKQSAANKSRKPKEGTWKPRTNERAKYRSFRPQQPRLTVVG